MTQSLISTIHDANATLIVHGDLDAVGEFFATDYVTHVTDRDERGHGIVRTFVAMLRRAFPYIGVRVDALVEDKDRIAWQRTYTGTQQGSFMGFPACGRQIMWRDMVTSRFVDGLIAEEWVVTNLAERLLLARKKGHDVAL